MLNIFKGEKKKISSNNPDYNANLGTGTKQKL